MDAAGATFFGCCYCRRSPNKISEKETHMLEGKILSALNDQLNAEFFSAYQYLAISAYFEDKGLKGFAHWMRMQYEEELIHASKIFDYINNRDGRVILQAIGEPVPELDSPVAAFEFALQCERNMSEKIYHIVDLSLAAHDHGTHAFLQWFVNEQVEEEAMVRDIVQNLEMVMESRDGLFLMDRDLAQRQAEVGGQAIE